MKNRTQVYAFFKRYMFRVLMIVSVLLPFFIGCGLISSYKWKYDPEKHSKDDIRRLFNIHGGNWWNYYNRGLSFMEAGCWEDAIEDFENARSMRGEDQTSARTYGVHRMEYFVNRELGIAYYKNAQNLRFIEREFESASKIEQFCETIGRCLDNTPLDKFKNTKNNKKSIEWLNELLEESGLYDVLKHKNSERNLPDNTKIVEIEMKKKIDELDKKTASYRTRSFNTLDNKQQITIKRLNRLILEHTYPDKPPKIEEQYQLAVNRLVASLDMIESSRTQFYLSKCLQEKNEGKSVARPTITIQPPQDGEVLEDSVVLLSVSIEDGSFIDSIWINNKKTFIQIGKTSFEFKKYFKLPKNRIIKVAAKNLFGAKGTDSIKVSLSQQNKKASNNIIQPDNKWRLKHSDKPILLASTDGTIILSQFVQEMDSKKDSSSYTDKQIFSKLIKSAESHPYNILLCPFKYNESKVPLSDGKYLDDLLFTEINDALSFKKSNRFNCVKLDDKKKNALKNLITESDPDHPIKEIIEWITNNLPEEKDEIDGILTGVIESKSREKLTNISGRLYDYNSEMKEEGDVIILPPEDDSNNLDALKYRDFSPEEFGASSTSSIKNLCEVISRDIPKEENINDLEWLNKLLENTNLYNTLQKKGRDDPNSNVNEIIRVLELATEGYRGKDFKNLSKEQRYSIKKLNRLLLEDTYKETPKYQNVKFVIDFTDNEVNNEKARKVYEQNFVIRLKQKLPREYGRTNEWGICTFTSVFPNVPIPNKHWLFKNMKLILFACKNDPNNGCCPKYLSAKAKIIYPLEDYIQAEITPKGAEKIESENKQKSPIYAVIK